MIRVAKRDDFIAIAGALDENQRRMLRAVAPEPTPLAPLMRLAAINPIAATVERDGKPMVVAGAVIDDPRTAGEERRCTTTDLAPLQRGVWNPRVRRHGVSFCQVRTTAV
jgi:hypothetical protein